MWNNVFLRVVSRPLSFYCRARHRRPARITPEHSKGRWVGEGSCSSSSRVLFIIYHLQVLRRCLSLYAFTICVSAITSFTAFLQRRGKTVGAEIQLRKQTAAQIVYRKRE